MRPLITLAIAAFITVLSGCTSTSDQQYKASSPQTFVVSQGLEVQLTAPLGFKLTKEHYGFVQEETFSRIKIQEVEIPYTIYVATLTKESLLREQLQLAKTEQVEIKGAKCLLLTLRRLIAGTYYEELWLISGDKLSSLKIKASYPEGSSLNHKQAIKQSLLSMSVNTENSLRVYTGLPFLVKPTSNLKLTQRSLNSVVFLPLNINNASIVISHGRLSQDIESTESLSEHLLKQSKSFSDVEVKHHKPIKLDNIPAIVSEASAVKNGKQVWISQITSSQNGKFLLIQGLSKTSDKQLLNKKFEEVIHNFKFK